MKARGLPQRRQRRFVRELNFGARFALTIMDVFANAIPPVLIRISSLHNYAFANGMPMSFNNSLASSFVFAVVTIVMSIP